MQHDEKQILDFISGRTSVAKQPSKQLTSLLHYLFQNPKNLGTRFSKLSLKVQQRKEQETRIQYNHGLQIPMILKLYSTVNEHKLNDVIAISLKKSIDQLQNQEKFKNFISIKENIRFFFIVLLWDKLFLYKQNNRLLLDFQKLVAHMKTDPALQRMFINWCDDLPKDYLKMTVKQLHAVLEQQFIRLQPANIVQQQLKTINQNILDTLQLMQVLYNSNKKNPRIKYSRFAKTDLAERFRHVDIFKLYLKKTKSLNFARYPFVMDLDYKFKLLQIQSTFEQRVNIQKNLQNGLQNLMNGMVQLDVNGNLSFNGLIFLHFQINRNNILDDSMQKLGKAKHNLKSPMRIEFLGEQGSDEGGVKNEYFQLVTKQIFNPYLDMFLPKNSGRFYWFNGYSFEPPIRFEFVGMLFALAIYNNVHLDVRFPKVLYKRLLYGLSEENSESVQELVEDLNQIQPDISASLKQILKSTEPLDDMELYFNIQLENFGQKVMQTLVQDGDNIKLSQDNKNEYCYMYADYILNKHVEKQLKAFKKGFDRVCNTDLIKILEPEQLEVIICGKQVIDFAELQAHTNYQGYTKDTPVVKNLWKILKDLSQQDKKGFLFFCTGSDRVPLEGMKSMNFTVQKHANTNSLPTAHTCFNVFLLPEYETKEKLKKNIELVIQNNQGFGLI